MKHVVKLIIVSNEGDDALNLLRQKMTQIPAAGGIVWNERQQLLVIKRFGKWDLPKGKIETAETTEQAAIREVEEECGISGLKILNELPATFHIYRSPYIKQENNWVLKKTHWFEMGYSGNDLLKPQIEEQIEEVRWFNRDELDNVYQNTYGNMRQLLQNYLD
ncbi:MAG TPA: NUDIX domain-containing protein [Sunxiuqinia sp.]|nr:NUDIX domain-containing protein [Sunxiuqinia sp.]